MSQQSCLPLPNSKERKTLLKGKNKTNNDVEQQKGVDDGSISGKLRIKDLSEMSALEYLAQVHEEARKIPSISTALSSTSTKVEQNQETALSINEMKEPCSPAIDGTSASLQYLFSQNTSLPKAPPYPSPFLPKDIMNWVDSVLSDFSHLRLYMERCASLGVGAGRTIKNLPPMKDKFSWHAFCLGKDESEGNVNNYFDQSDNDDEEESDIEGEDDSMGDSNNVRTSKQIQKEGHPPTLQLLLQMDQVMTRRVLSHHVYFLQNKWEATASRMLWIYALLSRIEKPLHRDDLHVLRSLLRECCRRRWDLFQDNKPGFNHVECTSDKSSSVKGLNLVICIVGLYFEQGTMEDIVGVKASR